MTASQRLYLAGVLPSRQEASAEHGGGDPVGVGPLAVLLGQGGQVQAVQALQTTDWPPSRSGPAARCGEQNTPFTKAGAGFT